MSLPSVYDIGNALSALDWLNFGWAWQRPTHYGRLPEEEPPPLIRRRDLEEPLYFLPGSPLRAYLVRRGLPVPPEDHHVTARQILAALGDIIQREHLFDDRAPEIVLCDLDLDRALRVRVLHRAEVKDFVARQLTRTPHSERQVTAHRVWVENRPGRFPFGARAPCYERDHPEPFTDHSALHGTPLADLIDSTSGRLLPYSRLPFRQPSDVSTRYTIDREFHALLRIDTELAPIGHSLQFEDIKRAVCTYIDRRPHLFDRRHGNIAILQRDQLGVYLDTPALHQVDIDRYIRAKGTVAPMQDFAPQASPCMVDEEVQTSRSTYNRWTQTEPQVEEIFEWPC